MPLTASGAPKTYTLQAKFFNQNNAPVAFDGQITAVYVPFAQDGDNSL